jgi:hypothetical protein
MEGWNLKGIGVGCGQNLFWVREKLENDLIEGIG